MDSGPSPSSSEDDTDSAELKQAEEVRDARGEELKRKHATYVGGYKDGVVVAGCSSNPMGCAEDDIARQIGPDARMTGAKGWRRNEKGELEFRDIPVCTNCQGKYDRSQFPRDVTYDEDGEWSKWMKTETQESIRQEVLKTDWSTFNGPVEYKSDKVADTLVWLLNLERLEDTLIAWGRIVSVFGNDHAGVYFPALWGALDILISIERHSLDPSVKACVAAILNNFYYFEPEVGDFGDYSQDELKSMVREKLAPYSDEH